MIAYIPSAKQLPEIERLPHLRRLPGLVIDSVVLEVNEGRLHFAVDRSGPHLLPAKRELFVYNERWFIVTGVEQREADEPKTLVKFLAAQMHTAVLRNGPPMVEGMRLASDEPLRAELVLPFHTQHGDVEAVFTSFFVDGKPKREGQDVVYLFERFKPKK